MNNERGQALLEYMLILIVSVALILGLMFEFNTAFQAWANNYFGDYLTCLLETGELPSIGGSPGDTGICNQFFQPFSLSNGRPSAVLSQGGGGGGGSAPVASPPAQNEGSPPRTYGGSGNGSWNAGSSTAPPLNADDGSGGKADAKKNTGDISISSGGYSSASLNRRRGGDGGAQISGRISGGFKKESDEKKAFLPGTIRAEAEGLSPKHFKLKPARKPAANDNEGTPLTFGNFIRLLIIAAIIIALVVVVGGQLLQITKSMDSD